jgi:hypothetical protein
MLFSPVWLNANAAFYTTHLSRTHLGVPLDAAMLPFAPYFASLEMLFF